MAERVGEGPAVPSMPGLVCHGCGAEVEAISAAGIASSCPRRDEGDVDHVLRPQAGAWSREAGARSGPEAQSPRPEVHSDNPLIRYRTRLTAYAAARALGMEDAEFVALAERLDAGIARVDGRGIHTTPTRIERRLATEAGLTGGEIVVKVEAGQVSGSHKSRHLGGIVLMLEVEAWARQCGSLPPAPATPQRLAIASCGNAALAAAVVARAAGRALDVFVPTWASESVAARLQALGAIVNVCARDPDTAGDPCYHAFRAAIARGAMPFCCQGPDNGLTIEGGETLVWEMLDALDGRSPDAVFVQVGGGALATAVAYGFRAAHRAGGIAAVPRLHAVQTYGCAPLVRAYDLVVARILGRTVAEPGARVERARLAAAAPREVVDEALRFAATHRSAFMWPWETEPRSHATGILDDETYDWLAIVEAMLTTGGYPVLASEATLQRANGLAHELTGVDACMTGTAGLAGLMDAVPLDERLAEERVAVVFSGKRR